MSSPHSRDRAQQAFHLLDRQACRATARKKQLSGLKREWTGNQKKFLGSGPHKNYCGKKGVLLSGHLWDRVGREGLNWALEMPCSPNACGQNWSPGISYIPHTINGVTFAAFSQSLYLARGTHSSSWSRKIVWKSPEGALRRPTKGSSNLSEPLPERDLIRIWYDAEGKLTGQTEPTKSPRARGLLRNTEGLGRRVA